MIGTFVIATAATGSFTSRETTITSDLTPMARATESPRNGALDMVDGAARTLVAESAETSQYAHAAQVKMQRRKAAEQAARSEREARRWVLPLADYRITARFGDSGRMWADGHTGIDLAAPHGAPVGAVSSGEIIFAGWDGPYGYKVVIRHWDGTETWYCHLSRITQDSGDVEPGDVIGRVGATGNVSGPHLHLEVRPNGGGAPVDPAGWLAERDAAI